MTIKEALEAAAAIARHGVKDGGFTDFRSEPVADAILALIPDEPAETIPEVLEFQSYVLNRDYKTQAGETVRFVTIANAGTSYETMADEQGVHRYTRRDYGRCTGTAHDYSEPRNVPPVYRKPFQPIVYTEDRAASDRAAVLEEVAIKASQAMEDVHENHEDGPLMAEESWKDLCNALDNLDSLDNAASLTNDMQDPT